MTHGRADAPRRRFLARLGALGLGAAAAGTHAATEVPVLRVWVNGDKGYQGIAQTGERFTRDTGVVVQVEHPENAVSKFEQAAAAGKGPDIWIWPHDRLGTYLASGLIRPVTPSRRTLAAIDPQAWSAWQQLGRTWGFPLAMEGVALLYNKALVKQPPETWDEVLQLDRQLAPRGQRAIAWWTTEAYYSWSLFTAGGGYAFGRRPDGRYDPRDVGVASEGARRGLRTLMRLVEQGVVARTSSYAEAEGALNEGRVAMSFNGPWAWRNLAASGIDFGVAPGPRIGGRPGGAFVGVLGAMVASGSRWPELAHEFIEAYLLSTDGLRAMDAHVPLGVPADKALYAERAADPRIAGSMAAIRAGELIPSLPEMSRFWSAMSAALQNIVQGREGVDEGLARAAARIRGSVS